MGETTSEIPRTIGVETIGELDLETGDVRPGRFALFAWISGISLVGLAVLRVFDDSIQNLLGGMLKNVGVSAQVMIIVIVILFLVIASTCGALAAIEARRRGRVLKTATDRLRRAERVIKRMTEEEKKADTKFDQRIQDALAGEWRVWVRQKVRAVPPIPPLADRKTPFVTFLNLKGGVGKTFLAANVTAMLGLEKLLPGRALLFDLDFQGTLSEGSVSRDQLGVMLNGDRSVRQLWDVKTLGRDQFKQLVLPMNGNDAVDVCPAENSLDEMDFRAQTQHLLMQEENRFHFRQLLHQDWLYEDYGFVAFDCPPRLTASAINALAASDFIVIPTRLESHSTRAVPNTLVQIRALQKANVTNANILGIIPNEVSKSGDGLSKTHQDAYGKLFSNLEAYLSSDSLFPVSGCAPKIASGMLPAADAFDTIAAKNPAVAERLKPTAEEFARRVKNEESYPITL